MAPAGRRALAARIGPRHRPAAHRSDASMSGGGQAFAGEAPKVRALFSAISAASARSDHRSLKPRGRNGDLERRFTEPYIARKARR